MDFTNISVNEFIKYFIKQNRKRFGYDWYEDRKAETRSGGFVFCTNERVHTTAAKDADSPRKADNRSENCGKVTVSATKELEIW